MTHTFGKVGDNSAHVVGEKGRPANGGAGLSLKRKSAMGDTEDTEDIEDIKPDFKATADKSTKAKRTCFERVCAKNKGTE